MTAITERVSLGRQGRVVVITVDNSPVNALGVAVRRGLRDGVAAALADPGVDAIVIACAGRTFIVGADITEFGKPPKAPGLHEVLAAVESAPKPVVAAVASAPGAASVRVWEVMSRGRWPRGGAPAAGGG
jgi:3-hydroxyacyl-CoA dehydrogenase